MPDTTQHFGTIIPVIVGSDIADYSLARIFFEYGGLKSLVLTEFHRGPIDHSSILEVRLLPKGTLSDDALFLAALSAIVREFPDRQLIFLANSDEGVEFAMQHESELKDHWVLPYSSWETICRVNSKEQFAEVCLSLGLAVPTRSVLSLSTPESWDDSLSRVTFPIVVKPLNGAETNAHWRYGLRKIRECANRTEALEYFHSLHEAGVGVKLMLQDLIPGDDTTQWIVNGYVDQFGEITVSASGRVILGLHEPRLIGNAAIILIERNEQLIADAERIVKAAGIRGFFSLDVKIDPRDGIPRWLDLNPRIGRSHYYLKVAGIDMAAAMLKDFAGEHSPYQTNSRTGIYTVVPMVLANRRYIHDQTLYTQVRKARPVVNPLKYSADRHVKRTLYRILNGINQVRAMRRWYPRATESGF